MGAAPLAVLAQEDLTVQEEKEHMDPIKARTVATVRQLEYLEAVEKHGSNRAAARALGVAESAIRASLSALGRKVSMAESAPDAEGPDSVPTSSSTLYGADGKAKLQWVKVDHRGAGRRESLRAAAEALAEELPRTPPAAAPRHTAEDLCTVYTLTDCHVGMLAWHKEGGADWDLDIAEQVLTGAFDRLVGASPNSDSCVIAQLGDFLHSDGLLPVTPTSNHILDQDGRFSKVVQVAVRILRRLIGRALERHSVVHVLMAEGNHDMASAVWLRVMFKALYEDEPRVRLIDSELPYYALQHGNVMLSWHHGHLKKNDGLPLLFATQYPSMWGETSKRYCHTGHRHHVEEKEHSGMTVIQHSTLSARDAYAARGGWHSERQATSMTYHKLWGQVERHTVTPEMVQ